MKMKKKMFLFASMITCLLMITPAGVFAYDLGGLSVHGLISQGYLKSNDNNYLAQTADGTFEFNESAINFSIEPVENLRLGLQLMSRDLGGTRSNDIYLDWGYADYRFNDAFGIRVGKIKLPRGLYNQTRDVDFLRTNIMLPQSIYTESGRDLVDAYQGGSIYGNFDIGALGNIEYEALVGTFIADSDSPFMTNYYSSLDPNMAGSSGASNYAEMSWGFAPAIRWNTPIEGLRFGITSLFADMSFGGDYFSNFFGSQVTMDSAMKFVESGMPTLSVEYVRNKLKLAAEYTQLNADADITMATGIPGVGTVDVITAEVRSEGFYGAVSYQFCDWFEAGTYYSVYYADRDDRDGDNLGPNDHMGYQKDWTISARFNVLSNMTLKFETHFIDGAALVYPHENPDGVEDSMVLFATKCSINF
jgi:hypothetical protein